MVEDHVWRGVGTPPFNIVGPCTPISLNTRDDGCAIGTSFRFIFSNGVGRITVLTFKDERGSYSCIVGSVYANGKRYMIKQGWQSQKRAVIWCVEFFKILGINWS